MADYGQETLPPIPSSDPRSLEWNKKDHYYDVKTRDFWGKAKLIREELKDFPTCEHYFIKKGDGVECKTCHIGLIGIFEISNGKLLHKGEPIGI